MLNQQDNSYTRFPHGTEVRFDCLRTEIEDNLEDESVIDEYDEDIIDEGDDIINTEEEDFIDEYDDTEIGGEYYEDDDEILNFRKKRAIKQRTKSRKKSNSKKNSSRRRNQNVNQEGNNNQGTEYNNQVHGGQGESVEDMLKKVKYRSWKIVCNDGSWIGKSLGCDENGNPLLDDENADVDYNPFNASCPYVKTPGDNLVAFHGDREITVDEDAEGYVEGVMAPYKEYFAPGAELVYRCKDIGT